ncbi:substrate-binding periplasmic protein [Colwelliaceae bacterium 6471]
MKFSFFRSINSMPIFVLLIFFSNTVFADTIIVRANRHSIPATFIQDNQWKGMDIDIIKEIFSRAQLDYQIVEMPVKRSLMRMQTGENHLTLNLSINENRSEYMHWLGPVRITGAGLVVSKKNQDLPIKTYQDLITVAKEKNGKFGYINGASYSDYFDDKIANDVALRDVLYFTPKSKQNRDMLMHDRLLGYFNDDFEIQYLLQDKNPNYDKVFDGLALHSYRIEGSVGGSYIGISKKLDEVLYQKISTAFQSMKADGSFAKIHLKWTGKPPTF